MLSAFNWLITACNWLMYPDKNLLFKIHSHILLFFLQKKYKFYFTKQLFVFFKYIYQNFLSVTCVNKNYLKKLTTTE